MNNNNGTAGAVTPAALTVVAQSISPDPLPPTHDTALAISREPGIVLAEAQKAAAALKDVITNKARPVKFNGEQYLEFEDWQTVGRFYGVTARVTGVKYVEFADGMIRGFEATADAIHAATGQVISSATSMCLNDENNWRNKPLFQIMSMAQCVPLEAEILTHQGFRRWNQVNVGDLVLAYDCKTDRCEWTPLRAISVYADQPTVNLSSRSFRVSCTDRHSWAVRRGGKRNLVETRDLGNYASAFDSAIVLAAPGPGGNSPLTDEEAAVLGWILTDGSIVETPSGKWRVHIDQSKHPHVDEIRELTASGTIQEVVSQCPPHTFPTGRTYATQPSHRFHLSTAYVDDLFAKAGISDLDNDFPRLATELSTTARKAMFDAMIKGDGHRRKDGNRTGMTRIFGQKEGYVLHTFRVLAALEGLALGLAQTETTGAMNIEGPFIRQTVRSNRVAVLRSIRVERGETQHVWCPTTDFGTWIMNLNGQVMITGNTRTCAKVLRNVLSWVVVLAGYRATPAEEMQGVPGFQDGIEIGNNRPNSKEAAQHVANAKIAEMTKRTTAAKKSAAELPRPWRSNGEFMALIALLREQVGEAAYMAELELAGVDSERDFINRQDVKGALQFYARLSAIHAEQERMQ